jgi:hypothetical protein
MAKRRLKRTPRLLAAQPRAEYHAKLGEVLAEGTRGRTWAQIAALTGYSTPEAAHAAARRLGLWPPPPSKYLDIDDL